MSERIRVLLILVIIISGYQGYAQRLGLLPPNIKWYQLRDDSLRIIFPAGHEKVATRVASLMLQMASLDPITTEGRYRPISVLLQPHTNISNGYVGLAPYVSEFYLQPNENPFLLGSLPWADLLALHEYRHVQQVNAANTGISHVIKTIFGELAFTGLYNLAVPNWYREGDAVYAETKWSVQGRGRLSRFTLPFHQKLMTGEMWEYYKLRNGSYKEYTPDHYPLGYLMVQYGNHLFGEQTWDTIIQEAANYNHLLAPFSGAVKDRTGKRNKHLYVDAMHYFAEQWNAQRTKHQAYPMVTIPAKDTSATYFNMEYPDVDGDGSIYTAITTFDRTSAICKITTAGKREKVVSMGLQQDTYFDHSNHRLAWTEIRFDPRWLRRDQNVIVVYDEKTNNKLVIQPVKGYYTPSLDMRGTKLVALHEDLAGQYNLQILDARTGGVLATLPNPENLYLGYPVWSEDELRIIATSRNSKGEMALVEQDIATGEIRQLTHYNYMILGRPFLHDHWIYLTTNLDELDQVFAIDRGEGIFYQVSDGNTAHYDPTWDPVQDAIICSQYRLDGQKLVRLPGLPQQWKPKNLGDGIKDVSGETSINLLEMPEGRRSFEIKKYSQWANFLNIHSWTAIADDPVWGVELRSDNIMNNISIAGGVEYNRNSKAGGPYVDLRLGMWYPVFTIGVNQTSRRVTAGDGRDYRISNERFNAGVSLPLVTSTGVFQKEIFLSSTYAAGVSRIRPVIPADDDFEFNYLTHRAVIINSRRKAYRQAMPTWAQRLDASYAHEAGGPPISQFYFGGDMAVPAFAPSHYTLLHGEFLSQDVSEGSIQLGSFYSGARGFPEVEGKIQYHGGITYGFPLVYPDIGIGNIFYTRRIRLQPFYDVAYAKTVDGANHWMRSAGAEFIVDFDFPPISLGLRYSRLLSGFEGQPDRMEVFIPDVRF